MGLYDRFKYYDDFGVSVIGMSKIILTNMCMLYKENNEFLVQLREKNDWPGLNFPGGHVNKDESIVDSVIREMKEETGLDVNSVEFVSYFEWNVISEDTRHLVLLFKSKDFKGQLTSSNEGKVFFINKEDVNKYPLSTDFDKILEIYLKSFQ